ncbi:S-layer homology domain-containing protein [Selenihalanaerobacter shriftii]|uniref:S-layer homology domain-containing protein n=1 Tax=Selenihalanaerobacter shriftii TaxID=142842 RepID=A0A1T4KX11_9FIRM|nr:S-layer homology domain-containing protein [Selenihalanaerobacter shriftii]SJZ46985.1 S-layer homology domain-containing protein [Selenihalanaerobacter shriftii]
MKKKVSILLAVVMLFALTAPVMANPFSDVPTDHWAYDAITEASELGIITGFEDGTFRGDEKLTRYQMAVIAARLSAQLENEDIQDQLTSEQQAAVAKDVEALKTEFKNELAALDKRVTALEDKGLNVRISGEANTIFTDTNLEGNPDFGTANTEDGQYWEDWDDTLDDDAPAQKEFKQELDFNIETIVDEDTTVNLTLDTMADSFANGIDWAGEPATDAPAFKLDDALLAIDTPSFGFKAGDFADYHLANFFYDDEDVEGVEVTGKALGTDLFVFRGQDDDATNANELKAAKVARNIAGVDLTGEYYQANDDAVYGVTAKTDLLPQVSSDVKYFEYDNNLEDNYLVDGEFSTKVGAVNAAVGYKKVGENFDGYNDFKGDDDIYDDKEDYEPGIKGYRVSGDMNVTPELNVFANVEDEDDQIANDEILTTELGAKYALTSNTNVMASYELADSDNNNDVETVKAGVDAKLLNDKLTTVANYELEDIDNGVETTTLDVRNKLALTEATALTADVQFETEDGTADTEREYYAVGTDHKLTDNTSVGVDYRVLDFEDNTTTTNNYRAESINGEFKVKF